MGMVTKGTGKTEKRLREYMSVFFEPSSVALVGATEGNGEAGRILLDNLLQGEKQRTIYPVNSNRDTVLGLKCYPSLTGLPSTPDLVVVATGARTVLDVVSEAAATGVRNVMITAGGFREEGEEGARQERLILEIARKNNMRLIGPNCFGVMRPQANLNATFSNRSPRAGSIAFLSQSGALGSAVLDWAASRDIGFSAFVSLGTMLDVDFGDMIDFLGEDRATRSIIIYLESLGTALSNTRRFISAARGFARTKPIIVLKPGRFKDSALAARSHTGAMVGEDAYYEAALDRAGTVRVEQIEDLFNCASILHSARLPSRQDLAIITNAGGPAVLATDALASRGGRLAELDAGTMAALNERLPPFWSHSNPVDVLGDADEERYEHAVEIALNDKSVSGVLVIYTPQGAAAPVSLAHAVVRQARQSQKPILTVMMGSQDVAPARQVFYDNNVPTYEFPEEAVRTYLYMYRYRRRLEELYETPEDMPLNTSPPNNYLKLHVRKAVRSKNVALGEGKSKELLVNYGINVTVPLPANSREEAARLASSLGFPVVMKVLSADIMHKSEVGGVALGLASAEEVAAAFDAMLRRVHEARPEARIEGASVQRMIRDYDHELLMGSKKDPVLGPVILFGRGGIEAEVFNDIAVGLPPLNQKLALRIMEKTRMYSVLSRGFRSRPVANLRLIEETLVKVSNLIIDFPEIYELDINPLVLKGDAAYALDARVILESDLPPVTADEYSHLVISPYPTKYVQPWRCYDGRQVTLRPIKPEDEPLERELLSGLSPEASRFRFFQIIKEITHEMLSRFCNIDYAREMAIIAEYVSGGVRRNVGVSRLITEPEGRGEFAVVVADDFQNTGLGLKLCDMLIGIAIEKGLSCIYGVVLNDNVKMLNLARKLGFSLIRGSEEESKIELQLRETGAC
jgi:acetyltransferase